jgi:hypothetical protein
MSNEHTKNWPDLAIGLYERLTGSHAEIRYQFEKMHIQVPSGTGPGAEHAEWILDGTLRITTSESKTHPN